MNGLEKKFFGVILNVAQAHGFMDEEGCYRLEMPMKYEDMAFPIGARRHSVTSNYESLKESG